MAFDNKEYARQMRENAVKDSNGNVICSFELWTLIASIIEDAPAVDAVEVVRCKECKSNPNIKTLTKGMLWCRKFRAEVLPNDFCSYGERR